MCIRDRFATVSISTSGGDILANDFQPGDTGLICSQFVGEECNSSNVRSSMRNFAVINQPEASQVFNASRDPNRNFAPNGRNRAGGGGCYDFVVDGNNQLEFYEKGTTERVFEPTFTMQVNGGNCTADIRIENPYLVAVFHHDQNTIYVSENTLFTEGTNCNVQPNPNLFSFGEMTDERTCEFDLVAPINLVPTLFWEWEVTESFFPNPAL